MIIDLIYNYLDILNYKLFKNKNIKFDYNNILIFTISVLHFFYRYFQFITFYEFYIMLTYILFGRLNIIF